MTNVPTEAVVLKAADENLESKLRETRETTTQKLNDPVIIKNITFSSESLLRFDFSYV